MRRLLFAFFALSALVSARLFGGPMDGTVWDVKVKPDSFFAMSHRGTLMFARGRLSVATAASPDFQPGYYTAQSVDGTTADAVWNASLKEPDQGVMNWHGLVRGDRIEGFAVWWTRSGKARRFSFTGSRREG